MKRIVSVLLVVCVFASALMTAVIPASAVGYTPKTVTLEATGEYTSDGAPMFKLPEGTTLYVGDKLHIPETYANVPCDDGEHYLTALLYTDGSWYGQEGCTQFDCRDADYTITAPGSGHLTCLGGNFISDEWAWQSLQSTVIEWDAQDAPAECQHYNTEVRDAVDATNELEGYSGDTYCVDCGEKVATGSATPVLTTVRLEYNTYHGNDDYFVIPEGITLRAGDTITFPANKTYDSYGITGEMINIGTTNGWDNWGQPWNTGAYDGTGWSVTLKEGDNEIWLLTLADGAKINKLIATIKTGVVGTGVVEPEPTEPTEPTEPEDPKTVRLVYNESHGNSDYYLVPEGVIVNIGDTITFPDKRDYSSYGYTGKMANVGTLPHWTDGTWGQPWYNGGWSFVVSKETTALWVLQLEDSDEFIGRHIATIEVGVPGTGVEPVEPEEPDLEENDTIDLVGEWANRPLNKADWVGDVESSDSGNPYGINEEGRFFHTQYWLGARTIWTKQPFNLSQLEQFTLAAELRMDTGWENYNGEYCSLYLGDEDNQDLELRVQNIAGQHSYVAHLYYKGELLGSTNLTSNVNGLYEVILYKSSLIVAVDNEVLTWALSDNTARQAIPITENTFDDQKIGLRVIGDYNAEQRYWTNVALKDTVDPNFTQNDNISKIVRLEYNPDHGDTDYFVVPEGVTLNVGDFVTFPTEHLYTSFGFNHYMINVGTEVPTGDWKNTDNWGQPWHQGNMDGTGWMAKVGKDLNNIYLYEVYDPDTNGPKHVGNIICSFTSGDDQLNPNQYGMCGENISWEIVDGTLYLTGTGVTNGYYNVGWINPFIEHRWDIQHIVIGDGITHLGARLFRGLNHTYSVTFGKDVKSMDYEVFYGCTKLTDVNFNGCSITEIGSLTFTDNLYMESIEIPSTVTRINNRAFKNCKGLKSITIPDSVIYVGHEAFYNCTALESVTYSQNCSLINPCAFYNCTSLAQFTVPAYVVRIRANAFAGCSNLTSVVFDDDRNLTPSSNGVDARVASNSFAGCTELVMTAYKNSYIEYYTNKHSFGFEADGMVGRYFYIPNEEYADGDYVLNETVVATPKDAYAIYAIGEGVTVTIEGGLYDGGVNGTTNAVVATDNAVVIINGGTFKATGEVLSVSNGATVTVTGGEFVNFDPTAYVAEGFVVEAAADGENTVYTVVPETIA